MLTSQQVTTQVFFETQSLMTNTSGVLFGA